MGRLYNGFWISVTVVFSVIIAILGFPVFYKERGPVEAIVLTIIAIAVVWIIYVIKAYLLTGIENNVVREKGSFQKRRKDR